MSLKIKYLNTRNNYSKNKAIFLTKESKISDFKGIFDDKVNMKIIGFLKNSIKAKENKIFALNLDFDQRIIIILLVNKNDFFQSEKIGAKFYDYVKNNDFNNVLIFGSNFSSVINKIEFESFLHGAELKSYEFNLYKSKKNNKTINFNILTQKNKNNKETKKKLNALLDGVNFTKDLVSEPGNILHPKDYLV